MEPQNLTKKNTYIIILIVLLIVFLATGLTLFINQQIKKQKSATNIPTVPTFTFTKGSFKLQTITGTTRVPMGQNVNLQLLANSGDENIVGWDLLLTYDPEAFDFVSAASSLTDFKIYTYKRQNYLAVTSIKSLQSSNQSIFKDDVVANLVFQTKKKGNFNLTLVDTIGKEKTNFVNAQTKRIYPQLNALTLEIY